MTYLIIGAALLAVLFVSIEARLRVTRTRATQRRRSQRTQRPEPQRLRRGRAELHLVRSAAVDRTRRAHG
ncbi:MAG: hypothetical protein AB1689_15985 [Thermodesulfobacteriota bacterium]